MPRHRRRNNTQNNIKDYLVPIVGGVIILLLIMRLFSGGDNSQTASDTTKTENESKETQLSSNSLDITFADESTDASIENPSGSKQQINDSTDLNLDDTIIVKTGMLSLENSEGTTISLGKVAEFTYTDPNEYSLKSSSAWIDTKADTTIAMRYANLKVDKNSIISITQHEAGSTIYVLKGKVKVSNLAKVSTTLTNDQKINVSQLNASKEDFDIAAEKGSIDRFFKEDDWFLDNDGPNVLTQIKKEENEESTENSPEPTSESKKESTKTTHLSLQGIRDEMSTDQDTLEISGEVLSPRVEKITINNNESTLQNGKFSFNNISLFNGINDIVIKMFDADQKVVAKEVYTVYSSTEKKKVTENKDSNTKETEKNNPTAGISSSDFKFTAPSEDGKYTTVSDEVTIRGQTTAKGIANVKINGYHLNFSNGSTWRYHAFTRFTTLKNGANQYKVEYLDAAGNVVYTDYFNIQKN